jgi:hypothetical protein
MENASKALLIAGAILIVMILIGIGVLIVNSIGDVTTQAQDSNTATSIEIFNSSFINYEGEQKGSVIKELKSKVISSNKANSTHIIKLNDGNSSSSGDDVDLDVSGIKNSGTYLVKIFYGDDGYINEIQVTTE